MSMIDSLIDRLRQRRRVLCEDESGGVTVEYVLWLPIWIIIMTMTADATILFHQRSQFFLAARDMSRQVAVGALTTAEAEQSVEGAFAQVNQFDATVSTANGFVTTTLSAPFESFTHLSGKITGGTLNASVTMYIESEAGA